MLGPSHRRCGAAGTALLIVAGAGDAAAAETSISLAITGAAGTRYAGQCTLTMAESERTIDLAGVVPRREHFMAEAVVCRLESAGSITVELAHDGSRSRSTVTGGTVHLAVR